MLHRRTQPDVSNKAGRNVKTAPTHQPGNLTRLPKLTNHLAACLPNLRNDPTPTDYPSRPAREVTEGYGRLRKVTEAYF